MQIVMKLKLTVSNISRKLAAVVSGDLGGRGICRRFAPQAGFDGNPVFATGCTDSREVQLVVSPLKTRPGSRTVLSGFIIAALALVLGAASPTQAGTDMCSFYKKNLTDTVSVVDGNDPFVRANLPGSSFGIDMNCEFRNFPISSAWPNGLTPTLNFYTPDKDTIYLVAFDNVWFSGNMACANIYHKLWVVNSEEGAFSGACQDLMIPAETITKQSPAATAMIGLPFTYTLTLPSMNYPAGTPSSHDLGAITIVDDLASTGADLTLVSLNAHYKGTTTAVPITQLSDSTNTYLHFTLPNIAAGSQVVVEVTAVLNDTPANVPGLPFTNTARWSFARWISMRTASRMPANTLTPSRASRAFLRR
jgi:hypothetical protein